MHYVVETLPAFDDWIAQLGDVTGRRAIRARLVRMESGLFGDCKPVGGGVLELRVDVGPGYRVYIVRSGARLIVVLCGGDKSTQVRDIKRARKLADEL